MERPRPKAASREVTRAEILRDPDAVVSQTEAPASWLEFQEGLDRIAGSVAIPPNSPRSMMSKRARRRTANEDSDEDTSPPPTPPVASPHPLAPATGLRPMPPGLADFFYTEEGQTAYWDIPETFRPKPDPEMEAAPPGPAYAAYLRGLPAADLPQARQDAEVEQETQTQLTGMAVPPGAAQWVPVFLNWVKRYNTRRAWCRSLGVPYVTSYNWTRTERMSLPSAKIMTRLVDRALQAQNSPHSADHMSAEDMQTLLRLHAMPKQKKNPETQAKARTNPGVFPVKAAAHLEKYGEKTAAVLLGQGQERRIPLPRASTSKYIPAITPLVLVECLRAVSVIILVHGSAYAAGLALGMRPEILSAFVQGRSIPGRPTFMALTTWAYQQANGAGGGGNGSVTTARDAARYGRYVQPLSVLARARRKRGEIKAVWEKALRLWAKVKAEEGL